MMIGGPSNLLYDSDALRELCARYRVKELSVFGSTVRGQARAESDIDLLVEFLPNSNVGLLDYSGLMLDLAKLFGRQVDLVSKNGLKPAIRKDVLNEARRLYAA